jgi:hypothetical protein
MEDGFLFMRRVVFEVVELLYALTIAVECFSAGEKAEVLGVGIQLVLYLRTHGEYNNIASYTVERTYFIDLLLTIRFK